MSASIVLIVVACLFALWLIKPSAFYALKGSVMGQKYSDSDVDDLARTLVAENERPAESEWEAIGHVAKNRADAWKTTIHDVIFDGPGSRYQWNNSTEFRKRHSNAHMSEGLYARALATAKSVLESSLDVTNGAGGFQHVTSLDNVAKWNKPVKLVIETVNGKKAVFGGSP